ncbi:hypothetical protein [Marinomonas spartinae]|uniref:hypothetical protein n=1 Tax=Marinomonas spartinae TaxID=1792290 RepID=UPI0018F13086|nr:hypothetical protein [Marinomonas spartinae]MBJ7554734.1 hypothetical protein [Marinomonas spartinae]
MTTLAVTSRLHDGKTLHYHYNQHSQLMAIELSENDENTSQTLVVFQYDKQNRLIQQTFGNHIALEQTTT